MQQQHIDIIQPQVLQAFLNRGQETVLAEIFRMNLCRYAKFVPGDAGFGQGCADVCLIAIHLRRIEGAVADIDRCLHRAGEFGTP